jgi:hypothetical protein
LQCCLQWSINLWHIVQVATFLRQFFHPYLSFRRMCADGVAFSSLGLNHLREIGWLFQWYIY